MLLRLTRVEAEIGKDENVVVAETATWVETFRQRWTSRVVLAIRNQDRAVGIRTHVKQQSSLLALFTKFDATAAASVLCVWNDTAEQTTMLHWEINIFPFYSSVEAKKHFLHGQVTKPSKVCLWARDYR